MGAAAAVRAAASVRPRRKLQQITRQLESARAGAADAQKQLEETKAQRNNHIRDQKELQTRNASLEKNRQMVFRIGINLGARTFTISPSATKKEN